MRRSLFIIFSLLFSSSTLAISNDDEGESPAPATVRSSSLDSTIDDKIQIVVESRTMTFSSKEERACVQTEVGNHYCNALNNTEEFNFTEAMKWFRKAADQNYAEAQYSIGMLYDYGLGVRQDFTRAMRWYLLAAAQNHAGAQYCIGMLYDNTAGSVQDFAKAMRWYRLAAAQNHPGALYSIGMLFDMGLGVLPDRTEAREWFQKAAAQGHELATKNIKRLNGKTKKVRFIPGLGLRR